ncbi:TPA: hypothetical protein ACH3X2_000814 [Trebouxia sp. C0005]
MYQDHLTAPVSLHLLGRPLLPASSHVAAQCYCFQAYTRGQVAPLLLLLIEHRRAAHACWCQAQACSAFIMTMQQYLCHFSC